MTRRTTALTCREFTDFLADYFEGQLQPHERARFEGHLAECRDCVAYLGAYADTMRRAKDAYDDDRIPADVPDELVRAILETRKGVLRSPRTPSGRPRRRS